MLKNNTAMSTRNERRNFIKTSAFGFASLVFGTTSVLSAKSESNETLLKEKGNQRLSLKKLKLWESLGYGMFISFGMSTYVGKELPNGSDDPSLYSPDNLNVDQWIAVAKQAGMKYAVLTTKHVAGHCLWPSKHTNYTVANSKNKTDVVLEFVKACKKYSIMPGFYYCSWDNHNKFGSQTPTDLKWTSVMNRFPIEGEALAPYTSSMYQTFQTAQITELLSQYGPIGELWIDIPGILGPGYRSYLYQHISKLQPEAVIMMNSGIANGANYDKEYAWPSDLIAMERYLPLASGYEKWRVIEDKKYYMPGEVCDPIGKEWFYVEGDNPRPDDELLKQYLTLKERGVNFLLDVPPNKHGIIPDKYIKALLNLQRNAGIK